MGAATRIEHVTRDLRVELQACQLEAGLAQREQVEFPVLRRLFDVGVFEEIAKRLHPFVRDVGQIRRVFGAVR